MNCSEITELISLYLDQFLDAETEKQFLMHINNCPACAIELEETKTMLKQLSMLCPVEFPSGLHDQIMAKINNINTNDLAAFTVNETINKKKTTPFRFQNHGTLVAGLLLVLAIAGKNFLPQMNHLTKPVTFFSTNKEKNITRDTSADTFVSPTTITPELAVVDEANKNIITPETKKEINHSFQKETNANFSLNEEPQAPILSQDNFKGTTPKETRDAPAPLKAQAPQDSAKVADTSVLFSQSQQNIPSFTVHCVTLTTEKDLKETAATLYAAVEESDGTILEKYEPNESDSGLGLTRYVIPSSNVTAFENTLSSLGTVTEATLSTEANTQYDEDTNDTETLQRQQQLLMSQEEIEPKLSKMELDCVEKNLQPIENKRNSWENETPTTLYNIYLQKG